jgi:hypothetical protein
VIQVEFRENLKVSGGKLVADAKPGVEVHAATYLRKGLIILEEGLLRNRGELRRILLHELFHFVWWKLGNPRRMAWEQLLTREFSRAARGELGWSAEVRKTSLKARDRQERNRAWREYCCESFCDSGASYLGGVLQHPEQTLAPAFRKIRYQWLGDIIQSEDDLVRIVNPKDRWNGFVWPDFVGADDLRRLHPLAYGKRPVAKKRERPQACPGF